jgi:hypothetical protein
VVPFQESECSAALVDGLHNLLTVGALSIELTTVADETLSSLNFWRIFHSLLRGSSSAEEVVRSREALLWATDNITQLRAVCMDMELDLLQTVWEYWMAHKDAPAYKIIHEMVQKKDKNEGILEALKEYEKLKEELQRHDAQDLSQVLKEKTEEYQTDRLNFVIDRVRRIANGSVEDRKTKKKLSGTVDAVQYFMNQVQNGMIVDNMRSLGGDLKDVMKDSRDEYTRNKRENQQGTLTIRTGLDLLDQAVGGIKRKQFIGILGFAGTRKSSLARTFAYNAALQGFTSVHVTLEQSFEEERDIYLVMHSHHPKFGKAFNISKKALDEGSLTPAEEDFLFNEVAPDFEQETGTILIKQPTSTTWEEIKAEVEFQNKIRPVDMLLVDYLTLTDVSGSFDSKRAMEDNIKNAKQWAFTFGQGRGLAVVTPVQGNRDGYVRAQDHPDHRWDMNGVFMYSEFDKSLDMCIYTYLDDGIKNQDQIIIGTCKSRRTDDCAPFLAEVNRASGLVSNLHPRYSTTERQIISDVVEPL